MDSPSNEFKTKTETYGALLLGTFFASAFTGIVSAQCIMYYKLFPTDRKFLRWMVLLVWVTDLGHSALIWNAMWDFLVTKFGQSATVEHISFPLALSVFLTGLLTVFTHGFFTHRIYQLSKKNLWITIPLAILVLTRFVVAFVTAGEMIHLRGYDIFDQKIRWLFSLGLALSSGVDVIVTVILIILLRNARSKTLSMEEVIDRIILYTIEVGSLTSIASIATFVLWIAMQSSLVFLGMYFVISKLYANSLLATLNSRASLRKIGTGPSRALVDDIIRDDQLPTVRFAQDTPITFASRSSEMRPCYIRPEMPTLSVISSTTRTFDGDVNEITSPIRACVAEVRPVEWPSSNQRLEP